MAQMSGNLWRHGLPYPAFDALVEQWKRAADVESRKKISFQMQDLFNEQPTAIPLYYPVSRFAYRPASYDQWAESPGFGIVHKWSFLPPAARAGAVIGPH